MDEREQEAVQLFAELSGLYEYEIAHGISHDVARRHQCIRRIIHEAGGIVPHVEDIRLALLVKGYRVTARIVRSDLVSMGWR